MRDDGDLLSGDAEGMECPGGLDGRGCSWK
jgi:hypothetical protein